MTQPAKPVTRRDEVVSSGPVFRDFHGKLANMTFPIESGKAKTHLMFTEMDVHKTNGQPYPHPAGEIVMNRQSGKGGAPSDRSPWGKFIIASDLQGFPDCIELIDKNLHMVATEQTIPADPDKGTDAGMFLTWDITEVDGNDNRPAPEAAEDAVPLE